MKLPDESSKPAGLALWFGLLLGALILIGSFYNLANYPTIWWDEAIFSEAAANLVQHGRYAFTVQSPNQLVDFDFRISAGPAVILPVALAYKLFGVSLLSGRLVAGAYLVLTFLALFLGARRLWGPVTALLAVALAFLGTDVFYWGRSVLGDIPALGLFLCATCFLIRGLESRSLWPLFWGGIFVGLAFNAKEFYGLAGLPPLVLLAQQHWRDKRRLTLSVLAFGVGAALPPLAYLALKAVILGSLTGAISISWNRKNSCATSSSRPSPSAASTRRVSCSCCRTPFSGWDAWGSVGFGRKRPHLPGLNCGSGTSASGAGFTSPRFTGTALPCRVYSWPALWRPIFSAKLQPG